MSDETLIQRHGAVQAIRMNRPDKKNAITRAMYAAMSAALRSGEADDSSMSSSACPARSHRATTLPTS